MTRQTVEARAGHGLPPLTILCRSSTQSNVEKGDLDPLKLVTNSFCYHCMGSPLNPRNCFAGRVQLGQKWSDSGRSDGAGCFLPVGPPQFACLLFPPVAPPPLFPSAVSLSLASSLPPIPDKASCRRIPDHLPSLQRENQICFTKQQQADMLCVLWP
jgi:hypothetical protein